MPLFDYICENDHQFERFVKKRSFAPKCPTCGEVGEKIWTPAIAPKGKDTYPFVTKDLTGEPIEIRDAGHEKAVLADIERRTGEKIRKRDDAAFLDKQHMGLDWKSGEPVYGEGSGAGLPGSWSGLPSRHPAMEALAKERYDDEED